MFGGLRGRFDPVTTKIATRKKDRLLKNVTLYPTKCVVVLSDSILKRQGAQPAHVHETSELIFDDVSYIKPAADARLAATREHPASAGDLANMDQNGLQDKYPGWGPSGFSPEIPEEVEGGVDAENKADVGTDQPTDDTAHLVNHLLKYE